MYNVLDDFHAIEAEVEAAGKTVMHVVFDGSYEVMEYDGQNYCPMWFMHGCVVAVLSQAITSRRWKRQRLSIVSTSRITAS